MSNSIQDDRAAQLVAVLTSPDEEWALMVLQETHWLAHASDDELQTLFGGLVQHLTSGGKLADRRLASVLRQLVERAHLGGDRAWKRLSAASRERVAELYCRLGAASAARHSLLQLLAVSRSPEDLQFLAGLLAADPPADSTAVAVACGPLFQHRDYDVSMLFPQLLDALAKPSVAPVVMDLANYVTREELVDEHPAAARHKQLADLLGALVQRLGVLEERPESITSDPRVLAATVAQCVSLAVSLCDALALIGDESAIGKLNQVLQLRHRRLRTEAAGALARLGDENGRQVLISLAAEPVARLRVLAYAQELGLEDQLDERYVTEAARAEAELACWLAQPTQLGFPPSRLELVDDRTQYWPGYDEPVDCFLFRFTYEIGEGEYSNVGISGPMCHAFAADLADLPPDDIYAIFAGWQAEHEEIYEFDVDHLNEAQRVEVSRLERRLHDDGGAQIQPLTFGMFFGDKVLVARAKREGQSVMGVATNDQVLWLPIQRGSRPLTPADAYCLFKGRRLLRAFNP